MKTLADFHWSQVRRVATISLICMGLLPYVVLAKKFKLQSSSIVPGASGEVKTSKDKNGNTTFSVEVKHLVAPTGLTPPKSTYVVWIQQKGASPESQGVLKVNNNLQGKFESSTPNKVFDL
jgi:non-ribosomal peptide synthetase component E (peptide arylation enzyme)